MKISAILDQIDLGSIALPTFQRGYVWNREQIRGLMTSLYRRYPVGSLLMWQTKTESAEVTGDAALPPGTVELLLDGQQRVTTLYGIMRGKTPKFFDGKASIFEGLHFHLDTEVFEFYTAPMKNDPLWIDVTDVLQKGAEGAGEAILGLIEIPELQSGLKVYSNRINALAGIGEIVMHLEKVTGEDKSIDVVVDIFNRVNSGGTKLSKGDLALAKICAEWPDARDEMRQRLEKWREVGFHFKLDWLLRCVNTITTGKALFNALEGVDVATFADGLRRAEKHVDYMLNLISTRLGLDHDRALGSRYTFPVLARYIDQKGGTLSDPRERDRLLYWYVNTALWGRYSSSTETVMNQDLAHIESLDGGIERLIGQLRQNRGNLRVSPEDFYAWSRGARFYPLLYMLTRQSNSKDWESGVELSANLLGKGSALHLHHIFPKSLLYEFGYNRPEVNSLANFTFLTQDTNLKVSNRDPAEYLAEYAETQPGVLESHWIPMERELGRLENYEAFLKARRELLADTANSFLDGLLGGADIPVVEGPIEPEFEITLIPGGIADEEEELALMEVSEWLTQLGLPEGEFSYEALDEETEEALVIIDLAWPDGLQEGLSNPVALLLDEDSAIEEMVNHAGFRFFTSIPEFKDYVMFEILAVAEEAS